MKEVFRPRIHPCIDRQAAFIGDRLPMHWANYLIDHSDDPEHSHQNLAAFMYANPGLHPEYVAFLWIYKHYRRSLIDRGLHGNYPILWVDSSPQAKLSPNWADHPTSSTFRSQLPTPISLMDRFRNGFIIGFSIAATVSAITIATLLPNDLKVLQLREYLPNEFNSTNPHP